ncbi:MAG: hypothetical protein KGO96_09305 [Elusimicrobia bacterium]|nr:hypothetical protein [Elusimicrobiota bacterium]MDE2236696.1 hypothetical protein [Elusimicrobiota bacterium]MDE2426086.1 hypothetical protein [Elusimicrobiota bacterium]
MKKVLALSLVAALLVSAFPVLAATATSNVTVTIGAVDKLVVTNGGTITLDNNSADPTAGDVLGPATDSTARLSFVHNKNVNKKITAEATTAPAAAGNDIQLEVQVGAAGSFVTVYDDNGAAAAQDAVTGIAAGALSNQVVTYRARATAAGTPVSAATNFDFTITFTSVDQ